MLLLFIVSSCTGGIPLVPDGVVETAIAQTNIAKTQIAVPTPTFNPNIPNMVNWLNDFLSTANPLGWTLDAEYHVTNISFAPVPNSVGSIFQVDVGCICMNSSECCIPERTFVVIVDSIKGYPDDFGAQVPSDTTYLRVVCSEHPSKKKIGSVTAPWLDVEAYLHGYVSGYQLAVRAVRDAP
jgi:hypothetical protein